MLAGTLASAGYWFGNGAYKTRTANPKGFFESREINGLNEQLLQTVMPRRGMLASRLIRSRIPGHCQRWLAQVPLDVTPDCTPLMDRKIQSQVSRNGFCFKDPRFSYTLSSWKRHATNAACICVFRHPAQTVESIMRETVEARYLKTLILRPEDAYEVWRLMYLHILRHHSQNGDWIFVHFDQLLNGTAFGAIKSLLNVSPDATFPEAKYSRVSNPISVPVELSDLYFELCERAGYEH